MFAGGGTAVNVFGGCGPGSWAGGGVAGGFGLKGLVVVRRGGDRERERGGRFSFACSFFFSFSFSLCAASARARAQAALFLSAGCAAPVFGSISARIIPNAFRTLGKVSAVAVPSTWMASKSLRSQALGESEGLSVWESEPDSGCWGSTRSSPSSSSDSDSCSPCSFIIQIRHQAAAQLLSGASESVRGHGEP